MNGFGDRALGIDASDGTLKAVLLVRRGRRARLLRAWRVPYHGEPDAEAGARAALTRLLVKLRPPASTRVVVGAPDRGHFSRTYIVPAMDTDQVEDLVRYEVLQELKLPEQELLVRSHRRRGVVEEHVHALALRRRPVEALVSTLDEQHLAWDQIVAPAFALASFVDFERRTGRDRVLLGVGQLATHLCLQREDGLWTRHLPIGLQHEEAMPRLAERLLDEVAAAIDSLLPPDAHFAPTELVLTEEGSLSAALVSALNERFDAPVERLDAFSRIVLPKRWGEPSMAQLLGMGKAFGLALAGLGLDRFHAPLLEDHGRRESSRRQPLVCGLLLAAAACSLWAGDRLERRLHEPAERLPERLAQELVDLDERAAEARADLALHEEENDTLESLALRRRGVFSVRAVLGACSDLFVGWRELGEAHLQSCWLSPARPTRPGLVTLTLDAHKGLDARVESELADALAPLVREVRLRGPLSAPGAGPEISRWILEVELP